MYYRIPPTRTAPVVVKFVVAFVALAFLAVLTLPEWGPPVLTKYYLNNWDDRIASQVVIVKARIHHSWPAFAQTSTRRAGE